MLAWAGCIAGALEESEYAGKLADAGFEAIGIEPTRIYRGEDAREFLSGKGVNVDEMAGHIDGKFMSAFVRAVKPKNLQPAAARKEAVMESQNLQRAVSLHGQHRALDHGGRHSPQGRRRALQRLLRGQPAERRR